jgi:hypothetical protein
VNASSSLSGPDAHGYHGFDSASNVDAANHMVKIKKGGWLPGMGTSFVGVTGSFFYVLATNGNTPAGVDLNWYDMIKPIVEAHNWGTADLFPTYGMPSFTGLAGIDLMTPVLADLGVMRQTMRQVEASMARSRRRIVIGV